ncbi:MAG: hypothetical protein BGO96_01070 [Micrococcales bacterium 73-15]|nr:MAG: hypothetical protein BGO96_01070 [Micrococcales bacterium 73-15]
MRAPIVTVVAGSLVLAMMALGTPASAAPDDDRPAGCEPVETIADAVKLAVECGGDVEVLSERSEWNTTYATPRGTLRSDASILATRTRINGEWQDVDITLEDTGAGIDIAAPVYEMTFSDGDPDQPLASIVKDGHVLTIDAPLPLTDAVIEGTQIVYPGVLDDVDLVVQVHPDGTGFSQALRVMSPEGATNPLLAELDFPVTASDGIELTARGGGFEALDDAGQAVFVSPTPLMWDSSSTLLTDEDPVGSSFAAPVLARGAVADTAADVTGPSDGDEVAFLSGDLDDESITITPDQEMLADPDTVWPVYIDPGVTASQNQRTVIRSGWPDSAAEYGWTGDRGIGYCSTASSPSGCSRNSIHRLVFDFGGLAGVGSVAPADVIKATFWVYGTHSWSCTATGVELWWVGPMTSSTTWNNHSWISNVQTQSLVHKPACGNDRWIEFNALTAAKKVAEASASNLTLGLRTTVENSMPSSWQRYRSDAELSVEYSAPPTAGTNPATDPATTCSATTPAYIRTTTPTLKWKVSDPDSPTVRGNLDVLRVSDWATIWDPEGASAPPTQASGSQFSMIVPAGKLADGVTYEWRSGGRDTATGVYGPMTKCRFTVDVTPPSAPPTLVTVSGQPATYPPNTVSGGLGQSGRFQIGNAGVTDVVSYKYSVNSDALNQSISATGTPQIAFTPTTVGSQRILVQSVDRAGNTGPVLTYRFSVGFPSTAARWLLDDATGVTATDAVGSNDLSVSTGTQWVNGPLADLVGDPGDTALHFDAAGDTAASSGPALNTATSYTVSAFVTSHGAGTGRVAVSQDGTTNSGFKLGILPASSCGSLGQPCWGFWIDNTDAQPTTATYARSTTPALTDHWTHLTGVYDATVGEIRLYVCDVEDALPEPVLQATTAFTATWAAGGPVQLGRGRTSGIYKENWIGSIDDVQLANVALPINDIRQHCQKEG